MARLVFFPIQLIGPNPLMKDPGHADVDRTDVVLVVNSS